MNTSDPNTRAVLMASAGLTEAPPTAAPAPAVPAQAAPTTQASPEPPAAQPQASTALPVPPPAAPAPAAEPADPLIAAITGQNQAPQWSDEGKKLFKDTFGAEDPMAFKEQWSKTASENELLRRSNLEGENLKKFYQRIEQEHPALAAALMEAQEGKDPMKFIASMPNANILGKSAKDLGDDVLAATYLRDQFSDEELTAKRTGNYAEVDESTLAAKFKMLRPAAEFMHEQRNKQYVDSMTQRQQARIQEGENITKSKAAALSYASQDSFVKPFLTQQTIESFHNGSFSNGVFTNEDGTLHPHALSATIKAQRYDSDVRRAYEAGKEAGKQSGLQEGTAQLPDARPTGRVLNMPVPAGAKDPNLETIHRMSKSM